MLEGVDAFIERDTRSWLPRMASKASYAAEAGVRWCRLVRSFFSPLRVVLVGWLVRLPACCLCVVRSVLSVVVASCLNY